jgi:hypothetical protein
MQQKRRKDHLETIRALATSSAVRTFCIGFTSRDPYKYSWYRENGWPHIVAVASRLTEADAKSLEKYLQECCRKADKRSPLWRKAHETTKREDYRWGACSPTPNEKIHAVYMAWKPPI